MKLVKSFNDRYQWWLLLSSIIFFLFIPALKIKFWWVDDGYSILVAKQVVDSLRNLDLKGLEIILFEPSGRFRTVYWLYQTFVYVVAGTNPQVFFMVHFLAILLTSIIVFEIVKNISKSNLSGFIAGALFILTPINTENLYRLGPGEPILALFVSASLYYLTSRKIAPAILFLLLATFTKETGFALWLPVFFAYLLKRVFYKKRDKNFEKYCIWGATFLLPVFAYTLFRKSSYIGNYAWNLSDIGNSFSYFLKSTMKGFAPFPAVLISTYIIRIISFLKSKKNEKMGLYFAEEGMFIILFLVFVLIQLPWKFLLDRYLMPATVGMVIFLGIELAETSRFLKRYGVNTKGLAFWVFIIYFIIGIVVNSLRVYRQGERFAYETNLIQKLYSDLSEKLPQNGIVLLNFLKGDSTVELVYETDLQLELFYDRKDARVEYLNLENLPSKPFVVIGTPMIREQYSREDVEKTIRNYHKKADLVFEKKLLIITDPYNLLKQIVKKFGQRVFLRNKITSDGIYTFYVLRDFWYQYEVR